MPGDLTDRMRVLRESVKRMTRPYTRPNDGVEVIPRYELSAKWPEDREKTVQIIIEVWKPQPGKVVVAEISGEAYLALNRQILNQKLSWESFLEQVVL